MTETEIGLTWIAAVPFSLPRVRIIRRSIVRGMMQSGWYASSGASGQADAAVFAHRGTYKNWYVEVEWKARTGRMRESQHAWHGVMCDLGIPYLVLRVARNEQPGQTVARWIEELRICLG